jgi:hypothetical protein
MRILHVVLALSTVIVVAESALPLPPVSMDGRRADFTGAIWTQLGILEHCVNETVLERRSEQEWLFGQAPPTWREAVLGVRVQDNSNGIGILERAIMEARTRAAMRIHRTVHQGVDPLDRAIREVRIQAAWRLANEHHRLAEDMPTGEECASRVILLLKVQVC